MSSMSCILYAAVYIHEEVDPMYAFALDKTFDAVRPASRISAAFGLVATWICLLDEN